MIFHFYFYRLKILLKNRSLILWTCLFPLMITTIYYFIFYNVSEDKSFINIPIAIQATKEAKSVGDYLSSVKNNDGISLFSVTYVSDEEGESLLLHDKVHAFISYEGSLIINSRQSNSKSLLKTYLDIYLEKKVVQEELAELSSQDNENGEIEQDNIKQENIWKYVISTNETRTNGSKLLYFYALIGLACMLGSTWGFKEMMEFYGVDSIVGLKIQISTMEKKHLILSNIAAIITVHFTSLSLLLFYLVVVLKVINYRNISIMILIVFIGSFVGINMGAALYMLLQTNKRVKRAVLNIIIFVGSIISGLFYPKINYYIIKEIPMIHYLNPASLITNAFYNLLYKEDFFKVYINLSILLSWGILFGFIALSSLRRRNYASI
jgi:ABC-2 type transport system permease protein